MDCELLAWFLLLSTGSRSCGLQELLLALGAQAHYPWRRGLIVPAACGIFPDQIDLLSPASGGGSSRLSHLGSLVLFFSEFFCLFLPPFWFVEYIKFKRN